MSGSVSRDAMFDYCCLATVSCRHKPKKIGSIWRSILPQHHRNPRLFCLTRFYQVCWHPSVITNVAHKYSENGPVACTSNSRSYKLNTQQPRNTANPNSKAAYCLQAVGLRCTKTSLDVSSPRADSLPKFRSQTSSLSRTFTG